MPALPVVPGLVGVAGFLLKNFTKWRLPNNGAWSAAILVTALPRWKGGMTGACGITGTSYKGALPAGWSPMKKQGAIILLALGRHRRRGTGNIVAAGYTK